MTNQTPSASGPKSPRRDLLEEAADLIDGDRDKDYGSPTDNFEVIAALWTARFKHKLKDGETFTAADYADAMILAKVARNVQNAKRDNWADIAGYAGCGYETTLPKLEPKKPQFARGGIVDPGTDTYITINSSDSDASLVAQDIKNAITRASRTRRARF